MKRSQVYKATKRHCAGSVLSLKVGCETDKFLDKTGRQPHWGCGGDVLRQTVPETSNGDWESSVLGHRWWTVGCGWRSV